mmetsp:Transcript_42140/g.88464  ORF Transcript_42140/g.88464 Transcript_42140/m.88464 type:complete len:89 (+) Transcript_42140:322-588(+)
MRLFTFHMVPKEMHMVCKMVEAEASGRSSVCLFPFLRQLLEDNKTHMFVIVVLSIAHVPVTTVFDCIIIDEDAMVEFRGSRIFRLVLA